MRQEAPMAGRGPRSWLALGALVALVAGIFVSFASPAGAAPAGVTPITDYANYPANVVPSSIPDGCDEQAPSMISGAIFSSNGNIASTLDALQLHAGDPVTMTWTDFAPGCEGAAVSLAVYATHASTFDPSDDQTLVSFDSCGGAGPACTNPDGGFGPLTIAVPTFEQSCNFQIDVVIGPPLAVVGPHGSYYGNGNRAANDKPSGPDMLVFTYTAGAGDCRVPPTAIAVLDCSLINGAPGVHVTVTNPDDKHGALVDILKNGVVAFGDVSIAPSTNASRDVPFDNNETATITVRDRATGSEIFSQSFTANCLNPAATAVKSCSSGGVDVHLTNRGALESVTFIVSVDGVAVDHVVAADGSESFTVPVAEAQTVHLSISADGSTLVDADFTMDCVNPVASAVKSCSSGGVDVDLSNVGGELPVTFIVSVDGVAVDQAADGSESFTVPVAEGQTVHLSISADGSTLVDADFTMDCVNPVASAVKSCSSGGVDVDLSNVGGELPVTFIVSVDGVAVDHVVAADGSESFTVPVAEGQTVHLSISADGSTLVDAEFTMDCVKPAVTVTNVCSENGGVQVAFTNAGESPVELTVTKNGTAIDTLTVAANGSESRLYPMTEDETSTFEVTGPNYDSGPQTVTHDCVEVQAETVIDTTPSAPPTTTAPAATEALARTGVADFEPLILAAGALLLVGGTLSTLAHAPSVRPIVARVKKRRGK